MADLGTRTSGGPTPRSPTSGAGWEGSELLVRLAVEPGVQVSTDRLIDDLWADAVRVRRNTVQSKVSRLRRALDDPGVLTGQAGGDRHGSSLPDTTVPVGSTRASPAAPVKGDRAFRPAAPCVVRYRTA